MGYKIPEDSGVNRDAQPKLIRILIHQINKHGRRKRQQQ